MKRFILVPALAVFAISLAPLSAEDPDSQSAAAVVPFEALLAQQKLDAFAARDPDHPGQYVGRLLHARDAVARSQRAVCRPGRTR
jgi:hypothetical protein